MCWAETCACRSTKEESVLPTVPCSSVTAAERTEYWDGRRRHPSETAWLPQSIILWREACIFHEHPILRIALVAPSYAPVVGGVETHVQQLATHLAALGHSVDVLTHRNVRTGAAVEQVDGVTIRRFPVLATSEHYATSPAMARLSSDIDVHLTWCMRTITTLSRRSSRPQLELRRWYSPRITMARATPHFGAHYTCHIDILHACSPADRGALSVSPSGRRNYSRAISRRHAPESPSFPTAWKLIELKLPNHTLSPSA